MNTMASFFISIALSFGSRPDHHFCCRPTPLLVRVPRAAKPPYIDFNRCSLHKVLVQVALCYNKKYIMYFPGIDRRKKGVLGWGHASYDVPVDAFCANISTQEITIYAVGDTLLCEKKAAGSK